MSNDYVNARWRKPVVPLAVRDEPNIITNETGRWTSEFGGRFTPEDVARFRQGYCCIHCWEPQPEPFPERCSLCGYPMRQKQGEEFAKKYGGTERDPRAVRIEGELDRVDDKHERNFYQTKSGILIPKDL